MEDADRMPTAMRPVTAVLCLASVVVFAPLWVPLLLAAWCADLLESPARRLEGVLGGRRRAAAAVVVLIVVCALAPVVGLVAALVPRMQDLLEQARAALEGEGSLRSVLLGGSGAAGASPAMPDWPGLVSRYGANAWAALSAVARASASAAIGVLVFIAALYTFILDGDRVGAWLREHMPIPRAAFARLAGAFRETGRGLIVAGGGTALIQGAAATVAYVAIGIPRALLLGPLTALCAVVPVVGTALVWIPLAIELGATGQYARAGVVVMVGAGVHSLIDNFVRPLLARYGRLMLPTFLVLVSMIGGVAVFGAAGALLGPLVVRLCTEALAITFEARRAAAAAVESPFVDQGVRAGPERVRPSSTAPGREAERGAR